MRLIRLISLFLVLAFLLTGCFYSRIFDMITMSATAFDEMIYTRPDVETIQSAADTVIRSVEEEDSLITLTTKIMDFESLCTDYITNYHLSNIHYSSDLTSAYWEEEYNFCLENTAKLEQIQEQVYRTLARSPYREDLEDETLYGEDFFADYDGELLWDDYFVSLSEQEANLESRYYELCDEADPAADDYYDTYALEMAQVYVKMVALRQEMAEYAGYPSFAHYTYDTYYGRDYTPEEAEVYLEAIGEALLPVYDALFQTSDWGYSWEPCSEATAYRYVREAAQAMGGTISEAFTHLDRYQLYDIQYSENKYNASFEVFLPSYMQPFIFMNPSGDQSDRLTLAHEFGHFANDYACGGSYAGIDVAEVHSQGFEYLSLCYNRNTEELKNYKMVDSLFSFMQCSAHALFELQVYQLTGDQLTVENILKIQEDVSMRFGFDRLQWESLDFVGITHFYTSPMYMVSYVVSNDLAMQIYQKELEDPGMGLALYNRCLESNESRIVGFAQTYGLLPPFAQRRPQELAAFFRDAFGVLLVGKSHAA